MDSDSLHMEGAGVLIARRASAASLSMGLLLALLGMFCVMAPMFTGIAVTTILGVLLLMGGIAQGIFVFQSDSFGQGLIRFLVAGLTIATAIALLVSPDLGLGALTIILAGYLVASGVADTLVSFKLPAGEGKGWMLFSGIAALALAVIILAQWPVSGVWAVGLVVGVRLMVFGMSLMALGTAGKHAITHLQDTRVAVLEGQVRNAAKTVQQTQMVLADHATMLLALDNELRKKVSGSEIDPAIVELNESLAKARDQMKQAAESAKEDWSKTQDEANAAFAKLQEGTAGISKRLKAELGLEP
ncbi:conserved hypothetical protein [gamma proteobacterium NOR5-3]|nr:conserved hypothetical protein [gamma proteobacterium NOR5-3]